MIGTGFVLVSAGIWLMYGVSAASGWTHLLPGMIVAGAGIGMVTVSLASTAVGVVPVARAGMASGINITFRQAGLAAGIAVLGSVFTARLGAAVPDTRRPSTTSSSSAHAWRWRPPSSAMRSSGAATSFPHRSQHRRTAAKTAERPLPPWPLSREGTDDRCPQAAETSGNNQPPLLK